MPDGYDTDQFARFVDLVNDAVRISSSAIEQMPQPTFGFFAFGSNRTPAREISECANRVLKSKIPERRGVGIIRRDRLVYVVEVLVERGRKLNQGQRQRRARDH